ncbi:putative membrane protein [Hydrogenivirga caldilitoris]|uniref:Putative membrane protein n=1 Tax=Hydrogenivirga caldilitoris TaxID=246264 RepID=A0A497XNH2_9AQUI|nr:DUF2231 domain-containing protein [Hydrogenivirga caldilitoris]RLJ69854.1 putative membrane protein [Hydrogenivirga caldilitoris]
MELIKIHPPAVHFAIVLPVALLILDLYYRFSGKKPDKLHLIFTLLASLSVVVGAVSGVLAHEPIEEKLETIEVFETHEVLGIFLALYFVSLTGLRLFLHRIPPVVFTLLTLLGVLMLFLQGNLGGSIVYDHMIVPWLRSH